MRSYHSSMLWSCLMSQVRLRGKYLLSSLIVFCSSDIQNICSLDIQNMVHRIKDRYCNLFNAFSFHFSDPDRFTWLLVTLASCSFIAGILSLLVPQATQNDDRPKIKSEDKEEKEMSVEINHAYEGDLRANRDSRSVWECYVSSILSWAFVSSGRHTKVSNMCMLELKYIWN